MVPQKASSLPAGVQIWIDGARKSTESAQVSVLDRGFLYGDSIFETLRTYRGKCFSLEAHMLRFAQSAERVLIQMPCSSSEFAAEIERAVRESGYEECYVRMMVTRGVGALGLDPCAAIHPLRVLIVAPLHSPPIEDYMRGIKVVSFVSARVTDATEVAGAKVGNYLVAVLANQKASKAGAKEALISNDAGEVVEGATSNVFWFEGETLFTPPLESGILAGITREHILRVAEEAGFHLSYRIPLLSELAGADGVFISSSIREMIPVVQIDETLINGGKVPLFTKRLHGAFRRAAGVEPLISC